MNRRTRAGETAWYHSQPFDRLSWASGLRDTSVGGVKAGKKVPLAAGCKRRLERGRETRQVGTNALTARLEMCAT